MKSTVGIIYLCHGGRQYIEAIIESYKAFTYPKELITLYFVPNGSKDGIADYIREVIVPQSKTTLPEVVLLDDGMNRGFAGGNNIAIQDALKKNVDYIVLNNGDLYFDASAIEKMVRIMDGNERIASVQPLVRYWHDTEKINVAGGMFHVAGYGYAMDNLANIKQKEYTPMVDIAYASGSSAMYRSEAIKTVGDLEEGFFMYHEDLELGLRLRLNGWRNVLVSDAYAFHDYQFSRNPKKFAWTELYRYVVVFSVYRLPTLCLIVPVLIGVEIATWMFAAKGGWLQAKFWACGEWVKPRTWKLIFGMRKRMKRLRVISDREFLRFVTGKIEAQEQHNVIVEKIANPILSAYVSFLKKIVIW